jgi:hypothetical protein
MCYFHHMERGLFCIPGACFAGIAGIVTGDSGKPGDQQQRDNQKPCLQIRYNHDSYNSTAATFDTEV